MRRAGDKKIADLLVDCGILEPAQADAALAACAPLDAPGFLAAAAARFQKDEKRLLAVLAAGAKLTVEDLGGAAPPAEALEIIPARLAEKYRLLPLRVQGSELVVAVADPFDYFALEDIQLRTGMEVRPVLALESELAEAIRRAYAEPPAAAEGDVPAAAVEPAAEGPEIDASAPEVERMVNAILLAGLSMKASHIHIEPVEGPGRDSRVELRYRVDGILVPGPFKIPWPFRGALAAKIKILTNSMNITERRIPQSGRLGVLHSSVKVDFRVETLPTVHGEAFVLTMAEQGPASSLRQLDQLDFLPDTLERLLGRLLRAGGRPNPGLVLVTGPAGTGKTALLYAIMSRLNQPEIKIVTAENPVEHVIPGLIQVPVNPDLKLGEARKFDFASALRSFIRFDPDVIMVGELRDQETAAAAIEASMRGAMVLSTMCCDRAPEALTRLLDMGLPATQVAMTLKAVLGLRLARRLCPDCKVQRGASAEELRVFRQAGVELPAGAVLFSAPPKGGGACCRHLGFKGRVGLQEIVLVDEAMVSGGAGEAVAAAARRQGLRRLEQDALEKVKLGLTTVAEVQSAISPAR